MKSQGTDTNSVFSLKKRIITPFGRIFMDVIHSIGSVRSPLTLVMIKGQYFENRKNQIKNLLGSYVKHIQQTFYAKMK